MDNKKTKYETITVENIIDTALKATRHTIKLLYLGKARAVKDGQGNIIDRDGTSGANNMIQELYDGFASSTIRKNNYADNANDTDDCIQVALLALTENMINNNGTECDQNAFGEACRAVRAYIYQQDNNTGQRIRRTYADNGDLLSVDDYQYIKYPHMYIDKIRVDENGELTIDIVDVNDQISKYIDKQIHNDFIAELLETLTHTQKRVLKMIAYGYTNVTIAKTLNVNKSTITRHIQAIQKKARDIYKPYQ